MEPYLVPQSLHPVTFIREQWWQECALPESGLPHASIHARQHKAHSVSERLSLAKGRERSRDSRLIGPREILPSVRCCESSYVVRMALIGENKRQITRGQPRALRTIRIYPGYRPPSCSQLSFGVTNSCSIGVTFPSLMCDWRRLEPPLLLECSTIAMFSPMPRRPWAELSRRL